MNEIKQLEDAVDRMDLDAIQTLLDRMDEADPQTIAPEDPALFAARIRKLHQRRNPYMNKTYKRTLITAACLTAALSIGVYASNAWKQFDFSQNGRIVTVTTGDTSMTEAEARAMAGQAADEIKGLSKEQALANGAVELSETKMFQSPEEAAKALGIPVSIPANTAGLSLAGVEGQSSDTGKSVWVTFEKGGKLLGVSVFLNEPESKDMTVISYSDIAGEDIGKYRSAHGDTFSLIQDEHGIYARFVSGTYEYIQIFSGFSEQEIHASLDSTDLSAYK